MRSTQLTGRINCATIPVAKQKSAAIVAAMPVVPVIAVAAAVTVQVVVTAVAVSVVVTAVAVWVVMAAVVVRKDDIACLRCGCRLDRRDGCCLRRYANTTEGERSNCNRDNSSLHVILARFSTADSYAATG
jgi:hypothetical protein